MTTQQIKNDIRNARKEYDAQIIIDALFNRGYLLTREQAEYSRKYAEYLGKKVIEESEGYWVCK